MQKTMHHGWIQIWQLMLGLLARKNKVPQNFHLLKLKHGNLEFQCK